MRGKQGYSLSVIALLALSGVVGGVLFKDQYSIADVVPVWDADALVQQQARQRIWRPALRQIAFRVGGESYSTVLYNPGSLRSDDAGNVFVLDYGDLRVKKFSPHGELLQVYGKGKGQGPGELVNPTDFAIGDDGRLWVCDPTGGTISIFASSGALERVLRLADRPYRLVLKGDGGFIAIPQRAGEFLFQSYDADGRPGKPFGRLIRDQVRNSMVLDGWLAPAPDGFVFASNRAGLFAAYDTRGQLLFLAESLDPKPLPRVITDSAGGMRIDSKAGLSALSLSTLGDEVHLFEHVEENGRKVGIIDTFRRDGAYAYSTRVPEPASSVLVTEGSLYTVRNGTVTRWIR